VPPENELTMLNLLWSSNFIRILIYFFLAWIISILSKKVARRFIRKNEAETQHGDRARLKRQNTIQSLIASAIQVIAFIAAILSSLALFIGTDTLVWMVGLFSAAFGLGARPLIGDYLAGVSFIFEDTFAVGEKLELPGITPVEGVVEAISLRTTSFRSNSGELFVVPNGEIRTVRNFSRGKFSLANIVIKINSTDLSRALPLLEELGYEAVALLPNLLGPWQIISEAGVIGHETELTLVAKAKFGKASDMRPRLLALIQDRLLEENIILAS
jgi:small-conductance mechanosensitive channel